jgi:hypothetical protein
VSRRQFRLVGLLGLGALLAQAGHLLVYQIQFGAGAQAVQSQGAHSYFPAFAKTSLGLAAAALLGCLVIVAAARLLPGGRPATVTNSGPPYIRVLATLFTIQITFFMVQETIESAITGSPIPSALNLILLGSIGQLPVALLAALALKWLSVRVDAALVVVRTELAVRLALTIPITLLLPVPALVPVPALAETCPTAYIKRGPPAILRA